MAQLPGVADSGYFSGNWEKSNKQNLSSTQCGFLALLWVPQDCEWLGLFPGAAVVIPCDNPVAAFMYSLPLCSVSRGSHAAVIQALGEGDKVQSEEQGRERGEGARPRPSSASPRRAPTAFWVSRKHDGVSGEVHQPSCQVHVHLLGW